MTEREKRIYENINNASKKRKTMKKKAENDCFDRPVSAARNENNNSNEKET